MSIGVHDGLAFPVYRHIEAWGSSSLKAMRRGPPARVKWEQENPSADTDATRRGSAVHALLLTPDLFDGHFAIKPEGLNFSTKDGKAWRDDPERHGKPILSASEGATVRSIVKALLRKLPVEESVNAASHREASLVWRCTKTGELCKGRPDWIEGSRVYDLKVSRHAAGKSLAYRAYVEGWMHQLAHYMTGAVELGLDVRGGRLVVVAPEAPHFVYLLEVKTDALDLLELENIGTLEAMKECRISGDWPDTAEEWVKIEPPAASLIEFGESTINVAEEV